MPNKTTKTKKQMNNITKKIYFKGKGFWSEKSKWFDFETNEPVNRTPIYTDDVVIDNRSENIYIGYENTFWYKVKNFFYKLIYKKDYRQDVFYRTITINTNGSATFGAVSMCPSVIYPAGTITTNN